MAGMSEAVRAYLPATFGMLAALRDRGELPAGAAYAVTPALAREMADDDLEVLEFEAFTRAAHASLVLLRREPAEARRRVVISVDAPVVADRGAVVRLVGPVPLAAVAAIHVDSRSAEPAVAAAAGHPPGDEGELDEVLEWYDVSELAGLVADSPPGLP